MGRNIEKKMKRGKIIKQIHSMTTIPTRREKLAWRSENAYSQLKQCACPENGNFSA